MAEKVIIGNATLYCADCMDILPTLDRVDAVITDPPYGIGFPYEGYEDSIENLDDLIAGFMPWSLTNASRVVVTPGVSNVQRYPQADWIGAWTWETTATFGKLGYSQWQPILFYGKDLPGFGNVNGVIKSDRIHFAGGAAKIDAAAGEVHTCPKPLQFVVRLLGRFTSGGESVLDPFMGSGTTGVACQATGRSFIGIEREPKYFEIACKRIEQAVAQGQLFVPEPMKQVQGDLI